jgi:antitoxin ParD1/3/4
VNVKLTPELKELVQSKVQSGRYESASEVVREALRLMERRDEGRAAEIRELRNRMDKGLAEARRGESADGEMFMQGMLEDLDRGMDDRDARRKVR